MTSWVILKHNALQAQMSRLTLATRNPVDFFFLWSILKVCHYFKLYSFYSRMTEWNTRCQGPRFEPDTSRIESNSHHGYAVCLLTVRAINFSCIWTHLSVIASTKLMMHTVEESDWLTTWFWTNFINFYLRSRDLQFSGILQHQNLDVITTDVLNCTLDITMYTLMTVSMDGRNMYAWDKDNTPSVSLHNRIARNWVVFFEGKNPRPALQNTSLEGLQPMESTLTTKSRSALFNTPLKQDVLASWHSNRLLDYNG
jgi:hypothetical protein